MHVRNTQTYIQGAASKYATITHGLDFEVDFDRIFINVFKHTFSVLRDNAAQMALQPLNKYETKTKYINIGLAFCASMTHRSTKTTRWTAEKVIEIPI